MVKSESYYRPCGERICWVLHNYVSSSDAETRVLLWCVGTRAEQGSEGWKGYSKALSSFLKLLSKY